MLYRGSKDGFQFSDFERKFFNKKNTVFLIKSRESKKIFGGYTEIAWQKDAGYQKGNGSSFIFSLRDNFSHAKFKCLNKEKEVDHGPNYLDFGNQNLYIKENCNLIKNNCANLGRGNAYDTNGLDQKDAYKFLAGDEYFTVEEFEVF